MADHPTRSIPSQDQPSGSPPDLNGATIGLPGGGSDSLPPTDPFGYELLEEIGSGGMGVVYRATDIAFGREVAVKVLHERYAPGSGAATRFLEEARITGQLQHPAIPPAHHVGTLPDGRPFLAMKLIKGHTLEDLLKARPDASADRGRFVAIFEHLCQAIAYAHDHKVIHRDLKPANVMVGDYGEVQVMDWGLAKVLTAGTAELSLTATADQTLGTEIHSLRESADASFTQAGSVLGTPAFMPPEQAAGELGKIDERADVFGLGAVLSVILTGQPPYAGRDSESVRVMAIRGNLADGLARLDECGAEPGLVDLCRLCLSFAPAERPKGAGEVAKAVAGLRAAAEERARRAELDRVRAEGERASAEARISEQHKRRRTQAALGLTFTALVILAGAFAWWQDHQAAVRRTEIAQEEVERESRRSRTTASVSTSLEDARLRIEEAWKLSDEPDKMRTATDLALAGVRRAEGFANAGDATSELLAELAAVRLAADKLDRYTRLFVAADLALQGHDLGADGYPDGKKTTSRLAEAFLGFGWDPVNTPTADIVDEIVASPARNKVLGFLCDWEFQSGRDWLVQMKIREVIRLSRQNSGGLLAKWQAAKDGKDRSELIAFAGDPDVVTLGPELLCALGRDLKTAGRRDALLSLLRRAADRYPSHVWINFDLVNAYGTATPPRPAEALRYAAVAAAARPGSALLQQTLASALMDLGAYDAAAIVYRKALAIAPRSAGAQAGLILALEKAGDREGLTAAYQERIRLAREAAQRDPNNAKLHSNLGYLLQKSGAAGAALAAYRDAARLDPRNPIWSEWIAFLLMETGDPKGAAIAARESIRLDSRNPRSYYHLGRGLQATGDLDGAIAAFEESLGLNPTQAGVQNALNSARLRKLVRDEKEGRIAPPPREVKRP